MTTRSPTPTILRAFSLVELAVVIAIVGVLAAIAVPTFKGNRADAHDAAAISSVRNVAAEARAMAAERVFGYGSVDDLKAVEPAITITAEHSTGPNEVSTAFETQQKAVFAALSKSGTCWVLTAPLDEQADTKPEGHELAPGELCRAGFVNLSPLVLSAVLVHPDGSETLTWEEDPEASYYEVCTDTGCSTTPTPSFTVSPGSGSVYVRAIRPNGSASSGYSYGSGSGGSGGSGGPATPPPAPDDDEPITATLDGTTVALSWGSSGPDAELYRVYRCAVVQEPWPGESCGVLAVLPATEAATYSHEDDVATLIAEGVELVRYQVVASAGIYQVASNWAEVELPGFAPVVDLSPDTPCLGGAPTYCPDTEPLFIAGPSHPDYDPEGLIALSILVPDGVETLRVHLYDPLFNSGGGFGDTNVPSQGGSFWTTFQLLSPEGLNVCNHPIPGSRHLPASWMLDWCRRTNPTPGVYVLQISASGTLDINPAFSPVNNFAVRVDYE